MSSKLICSCLPQISLIVSELSDEDMDDDSEDDEEQDAEPELTPAEKEEMMKNLVAPLSELEWGSKTQKPVSESDTVVIGSTKRASSTKTDPAPKIRPPLFAKQQFDGVESDSDEEMDEADLPAPGTLGRRIAEMKWSEMGPKIEEIDDEDEKDARAARSRKFDLGHDIDEQMRRKVWGENEPEVGEDAPMVVDEAEGEDVDMGLEEDEFIRFSKEALGIDENMWKSIVDSRKERGGESGHNLFATFADYSIRPATESSPGPYDVDWRAQVGSTHSISDDGGYYYGAPPCLICRARHHRAGRAEHRSQLLRYSDGSDGR